MTIIVQILMFSLARKVSFIQFYSQLKPCQSNCSLHVQNSGFVHLSEQWLIPYLSFFQHSSLLQRYLLTSVCHLDTTTINTIGKAIRKLIDPDIKIGLQEIKHLAAF